MTPCNQCRLCYCNFKVKFGNQAIDISTQSIQIKRKDCREKFNFRTFLVLVLARFEILDHSLYSFVQESIQLVELASQLPQRQL